MNRGEAIKTAFAALFAVLLVLSTFVFVVLPFAGNLKEGSVQVYEGTVLSVVCEVGFGRLYAVTIQFDSGVEETYSILTGGECTQLLGHVGDRIRFTLREFQELTLVSVVEDR